jgi:hypothetical protein
VNHTTLDWYRFHVSDTCNFTTVPTLLSVTYAPGTYFTCVFVLLTARSGLLKLFTFLVASLITRAVQMCIHIFMHALSF